MVQKSTPIEESNFQLFRDIISSLIIEKCAPSPTSTKAKTRTNRKAKAGRKAAFKPVSQGLSVEEEEMNDIEELGDFIDVCLFLLRCAMIC